MRPPGITLPAFAAIGVVTAILLANAHLAYVAFASQPKCVPHLRTGEAAAPVVFAAAKSSC